MPPLPKLLIIDSEPLRRLTLRRIALVLGVEVVEARNAPDGIDAARQQPFAAIVLGLGADGEEGLETLRRLGQHEFPTPTPLLAVGGSDDARERAYAFGAVDYLTGAEAGSAILQCKLRVFVDLHRRMLALQTVLLRLRDDSDHLFRLNEHLLAAGAATVRGMTHDELTRLPGRELFDDRLAAAIRRSERGRKCFAVARLRLVDTAAVTAAAGAAAVDGLLVATAGRLENAVRASDTVARVGPVEFAVLIEAIDAPRRASALGRKLLDALAAPSELSSAGAHGPRPPGLKAVVGLAVYPSDALDAEGLTTLATLALSKAESLGAGNFCVYAGDGEIETVDDAPRSAVVTQLKR